MGMNALRDTARDIDRIAAAEDAAHALGGLAGQIEDQAAGDADERARWQQERWST